MKISYFLNQMGVYHLDWYRARGLTKKTPMIAMRDSEILNVKAGESYEYEEVTEHWAAGRIDIRGTEDIYGPELAVSVMKQEDWYRFGEWLNRFTTNEIWNLEQLVQEYEKTNPKITWLNEV